MSGLLAALMLERRGWDVDVLERVETELAGRGAGILAQAELIAHVGALGLEGARPRRGAQRPQAPLEPHFQPSGLNDFHGVAHLQR